MKRFIQWLFLILALSGLKSCQSPANKLQPVSYADFEEFVLETNYKTDAEKYGWSIVQKDVYSFEKVDSANWRFPDGKNKVSNARLPVTQVSYNDAVAYCQWAKKRLPTYEEYWELVKTDERPVISDNNIPISEIKVREHRRERLGHYSGQRYWIKSGWRVVLFFVPKRPATERLKKENCVWTRKRQMFILDFQ
jgi:hypothetical protein